MILLSHPTGNANVRQAARALNEAGLLSEFWTSISWNERHPVNRVLPRSLSRELGRRAFPHLERDRVHSSPWTELGRLASQQLNLSRLTSQEGGKFSIESVYRGLDAKVASRLYRAPRVSGVYAYEDGALASFRAAKHLGIKTIYDLPIGYWKYYRELMQEEAILRPEWAATLQGKNDSEEKLQRKDEELSLADNILVASEFVQTTLRKACPLPAKITVIPYGAPTERRVQKARSPGGKMKVLFVGALTQRKGLSYLLQAVEPLASNIELTLVGRRVAECRPLDAALRAHHWIPSLAHGDLLEEMSRHDIMVFPSLFEGFGLVILEAMSKGLPVITTPNTGAPDFVSDREDGFIVPIRDAEAITEKLELVLDRDRLEAMSQAAIHKAVQRTWEQYRHRVAALARLSVNGATAIHAAALPSAPSEVCYPC
jgi:glycosyltransferase involved in cell wall biosynthesis